MQKLSQIIPSLHDSREPEKELDSTRADRVWTALAEMFGNVFFNQFGDDPPSVWVAQINQLTDDQVRRGLVNIVSDGLTFAPNLSQFVAACKRQPPAYKSAVPLLPLSDTERQINADKAWENMERLAGKRLRDV